MEVLRRETLDFISPDLWTPNSPDLDLVDYEIWAVMQRRVYQRKIHTIDELKQRLIEVWCGFEQSTVDMPIDQWRKKFRACVRTKEGHFYIVFELIDCLDFVNFLSPSLSCFA